MQRMEDRRPRQKSARKRKRRDVPLENGRAYRANGKPLIHQPSLSPQRTKGVTLAKLSNIWPTVKFCSTLGAVSW